MALIYMNARYYLPETGRFISADTIVPNPANPQAFNRYAYNLNNPINYIDPTGHGPQRALVGGDGAVYVAGALVTAAAVLQITPDLDWSRIADWYSGINVAEMWALHDNMAGGDDGGVNYELLKQMAGNVAGSPGNFDPNDFDNNPNTNRSWRKGDSGYQANYEDAYGIARDSDNYQVHHILPKEYRATLQRVGINVDHPAFLREVRIYDAETGVRIHQRLYTEVWSDWKAGLGRQPTAQEIVQFARRLEDQYYLENTLFYREGPGLPSRVFAP